MNPLDEKIKGPLKIFVDLFGDYLWADDCMQLYSNRKEVRPPDWRS